MKVDQSVLPEHFTLYPKMSPKEINLLGQPGLFSEDADIVKRSSCFLRLESQHGYFVFNAVDHLADCIFNVMHLPGLRGNPERIYKLTSTGPWYIGTFEHYTASIINEWKETKDERLKTLAIIRDSDNYPRFRQSPSPV